MTETTKSEMKEKFISSLTGWQKDYFDSKSERYWPEGDERGKVYYLAVESICNAIDSDDPVLLADHGLDNDSYLAVVEGLLNGFLDRDSFSYDIMLDGAKSKLSVDHTPDQRCIFHDKSFGEEAGCFVNVTCPNCGLSLDQREDHFRLLVGYFLGHQFIDGMFMDMIVLTTPILCVGCGYINQFLFIECKRKVLNGRRN